MLTKNNSNNLNSSKIIQSTSVHQSCYAVQFTEQYSSI